MPDTQPTNPELAIQMLIINPADQNLLFLKSKQWEGQYELLRGVVHTGETMKEACQRTAREHLGIEVTPQEIFNIQEDIFAKEFSTPHHFIFIGYIVRADSNLGPDATTNSTWIKAYDAATLTMSDTTRAFVDSYLKKIRS